MLTLLIFIATLSILIFAHEAAHFFAAKRAGVKVEEFGFGIPPWVLKVEIGETIYSLNLLPLGGFVKLKGEDPEILGFGDIDSFRTKSKRARAGIVIAGVGGNFLLAWVLLSILFGIGNPQFSSQVRVEEVVSDSPASEVGIEVGDIIERVGEVEVDQVEELVLETKKNAGRGVVLGMKTAAGEEKLVEIAPPLGVKVGTLGKISYQKYPWFKAPFVALGESVLTLGRLARGMGSVAKEFFVRYRPPKEVAGVVGIYRLTGTAASLGGRVLLQFISFLSLNLVFFNLLPIPVLDGGRLFFLGLEAIFRRRVNPKVERLITNISLAFLGILFILITLQDISRLRG